jgi:hypothetical protein
LLKVRAGDGTVQFWAAAAMARPIAAAEVKVRLRMV